MLSTIVTKWERRVLYFKEGIVGGKYCVSVDVPVCWCIINVPYT